MTLPSGPEALIILLVVVVLFGSKRLPDLARSVGRSMRIFKSEVQEMTNEEAGNSTKSTQAPMPELTQYQQPAQSQQVYQQPDAQPAQPQYQQPAQPQQVYQQPAAQPAQPQYQQPAQPQQGYQAGNYNPPADPAN